jgi:hypothetical protein
MDYHGVFGIRRSRSGKWSGKKIQTSLTEKYINSTSSVWYALKLDNHGGALKNETGGSQARKYSTYARRAASPWNTPDGGDSLHPVGRAGIVVSHLPKFSRNFAVILTSMAQKKPWNQ